MTEDIEQQAKTGLLRKQKVMRVRAMAADWGLWAWQFESFSTSAHTERKTRQNPADFLNWEDGTEGPERPWELEYLGQRNREEIFAERENPDACRRSLSGMQPRIDQWVSVRELLKVDLG